MAMSRNKQYEQRMTDKGLKKITLWVPQDKESDIKQAVSLMVEYNNLTLNSLRDVQSGRFVSMHRHQ